MSTHFDDHDQSLEHEQALREELKDGGPAFPMALNETTSRYSPTGMSLRDYFAAAALPELVRTALDLDHEKWDATAAHAYIIADAMIAESRRKS